MCGDSWMLLLWMNVHFKCHSSFCSEHFLNINKWTFNVCRFFRIIFDIHMHDMCKAHSSLILCSNNPRSVSTRIGVRIRAPWHHCQSIWNCGQWFHLVVPHWSGKVLRSLSYEFFRPIAVLYVVPEIRSLMARKRRGSCAVLIQLEKSCKDVAQKNWLPKMDMKKLLDLDSGLRKRFPFLIVSKKRYPQLGHIKLQDFLRASELSSRGAFHKPWFS